MIASDFAFHGIPAANELSEFRDHVPGHGAARLQDQGRLDEAETEYAEVLAIRHRLLGPRHYDTVEIQRKLAIVHALRCDDASRPAPFGMVALSAAMIASYAPPARPKIIGRGPLTGTRSAHADTHPVLVR